MTRQSGKAKEVVEAYVRANIEELQGYANVAEPIAELSDERAAPQDIDFGALADTFPQEAFKLDAAASSFGRGGASIESVVVIGDDGDRRVAVGEGKTSRCRSPFAQGRMFAVQSSVSISRTTWVRSSSVRTPFFQRGPLRSSLLPGISRWPSFSSASPI